jgi:regulator of replication initiation timing
MTANENDKEHPIEYVFENLNVDETISILTFQCRLLSQHFQQTDPTPSSLRLENEDLKRRIQELEEEIATLRSQLESLSTLPPPPTSSS